LVGFRVWTLNLYSWGKGQTGEKNFAGAGFTQGYNRLLPIGVSFTAVKVVKDQALVIIAWVVQKSYTEKSEVKKSKCVLGATIHKEIFHDATFHLNFIHMYVISVHPLWYIFLSLSLSLFFWGDSQVPNA
jgi:hypothetical protein